ncbi:MAG: HIT family protein [Phycisphaeraceae bacterium]
MSLPHSGDCIFCKIIAGTIPCHKVYEDEHVLSFLDVGPLSRGHTLVIPKGHWVTLNELPAQVAAACGQAVSRVGAAVAQGLAVQGWNVLQNNGKVAGQVVMHVHFHIIPRREGDELGYRWPAGKLDPAEVPRLLEAIKGKL